jgi:glycosyl transferase family 25
MGAYALVWSRRGAQEFLKQTKIISAPIDNMMQNWLCRAGGGFAIAPALADVSEAHSVIDKTPKGVRPKRGTYQRSMFYGLRKQQRLFRNRFWALWNKVRFSHV